MINESGIIPVEFKVLVKLDDEPEKTKGGLYVPDRVRDMNQQAQISAFLVAVGGNAFHDPEWNPPVPKVGDRVMISKYAGQRELGADGALYAVCSDKDIAAVLVKEPKK